MYSGKAISNKYVLSFLRKVSIASENVIVIGSLFQTKKHVCQYSAYFRNKRLLESDDLRVLDDVNM